MALPLPLSLPFKHERGHCWRVRLPEDMGWAADTQQRPTICPLVLFEGDEAVGPGHRSHAEIASLGNGRFSVWSDGWLYFSTTDNSDPNTNGRTYKLDLDTEAAHPLRRGDQAGAAVQEALRAIQALPPTFKPQQAYTAVKRGLDVLYPSRVLSFNADRLSREFSDLDLVAERYTGYQTELSKADAVFLSIYCAGRTWVRFFLQSYLQAVTGKDISLVPRSIPRTDISPSICFTHDFLDVFETVAEHPWIVFEPLLLQRPIVLLTRDLRDLAVSSFYYHRSSQPEVFARLVPSGTLDEYIDSPIFGIERLAKLFALQRELFERHPGPKLHISYEQLHATPHAEFAKLLGLLLSAPIQDLKLNDAVHKSSFPEMQALEIQISRSGKAREHLRLGVDNWSGDVNDLKVRSGVVGRFREVLPQLADAQLLAARYPLTARALA